MPRCAELLERTTGPRFVRAFLFSGPDLGRRDAERRPAHTRRARQAEGRDRAPLHGQAPRGRRAHQGSARVRRHLRELRVRRRQERAGDARGADRLPGGEAPLRVGDQPLRAGLGRGPRRLARVGQGRGLRQDPEVHDRGLDGGQSVREPALERVTGGQGPARPQEGRHRQGDAAQRQDPRAEDHQDRRRMSDDAGVGGIPSGGGGAEILAARRRKLEELRAAGVDPFPHEFAGVVPIAQAREGHDDLEPGGETDVRVRVAGRLAAKRGQGKAIFADLVDRSGRIQLLGRLNVLGEEAFGRLRAADLGDIVGADGTVIRSKAGELTISLEDVTLLAKSLRPPPEKHHGLTDTETRFRKRELDLMANEEAREVFVARARIITEIRRFLDEHGFVEVETPMLQTLYGGAAARPFVTHHNALDRDMYLRIATELYLKRLIVGGLERFYEIGKNFRNEGLSPKHNPEFTMLEWYEAYADYHDAAARLERVVGAAAQAAGYEGELDFAPRSRRR